MSYSLFGDTGRFYKANLHGHTTVSDGQQTPEEIREIYKAAGYQIHVYTDHNIMVDHSDLNEENFLAMTGCEYDFNDPQGEGKPYAFRKTYHMLLISPTTEVTVYPYGNPEYIWSKNSFAYVQDCYKGNARHAFYIEDVNAMIREAHEHGFLTCYNHPSWSVNTYKDYCDMEGVDFVECANTGCVQEGYPDDQTDHVYHDFLALGKRCFPAGSDDGHYMGNYGGSFTGVKADSLAYDDVFRAMKEGRVYASWGPEFLDLRYDPETKQVQVECTPVKAIFLKTERREMRCQYAKDGDTITQATFDISSFIEDTYRYGDPKSSFIRIYLEDGEGKGAVSRGYFVTELQ